MATMIQIPIQRFDKAVCLLGLIQKGLSCRDVADPREHGLVRQVDDLIDLAAEHRRDYLAEGRYDDVVEVPLLEFLDSYAPPLFVLSLRQQCLSIYSPELDSYQTFLDDMMSGNYTKE